MKTTIYPGRLIAFIFLAFVSAATLNAQQQMVKTTSVCRLYADFENSSSVQGYIPKDTEIKLIEAAADYLLVEYDGKSGWIEANRTNYMPVADESRYAEERSEYNQPSTYQGATDRFSILTSKYGYRTARAIYQHKIWKGMDHNMVRDSWGKPLNITRETNADGSIEMWSYRKTWLLFRNDILSDWGPNR